MRPPRVSLITCPRHGRVISFFSPSVSLPLPPPLSSSSSGRIMRASLTERNLGAEKRRRRGVGRSPPFFSSRERYRIARRDNRSGSKRGGKGKGKNDVAANALHGVKTRFNPCRTTPRGEKTNEPEVRTWPINTEGDTLFDQGSARNTIPSL